MSTRVYLYLAAGRCSTNPNPNPNPNPNSNPNPDPSPTLTRTLALFLQERRAIEVDGFQLPVLSEALHAAVEHTDTLGELFEQEFDRTLSRMMLEWCLHKAIEPPCAPSPSPSPIPKPSASKDI